MFDWNLYVPDFVRGFFVICVQIFEAYAVRTLIKSGRSWRKISTKAGAWKTPIEHYTAGGVDEMGSLAGST